MLRLSSFVALAVVSTGFDGKGVMMPESKPVRLVYNRVDKAGSTAVVEIMKMLGRTNNFRVVGPSRAKDGLSWFHPDVTLDALREVRDGDVWINHAPNVARRLADPRYAWINVVREPHDWLQSLYYYQVDPGARAEKLAIATFKKRLADTRCGCARLEFSECVQLRTERGCPQTMNADHASGQIAYFCDDGIT